MSFISQIASDIFGGGQQQAMQTGQQAAQLSDPFASSRGTYGTQLNQLMSGVLGGNSQQVLSQLPGYQFQLSQGLDAITRGSAASGNLGSPAEQAQMIQYAQGLASNSYNNYFNQLATLSGANWNNGSAAGQSLLTGQNQGSNQQGSNMGSMGSLLSTIGGFLGF